MLQPLLSMIIPVYNGQDYLAECLNSIQTQSFSDYEVIIVNDGSTDESRRICEAFVQTDPRFRLFSTENKGVSHARNYGMDKACGRWLTFLDCDDYLLPESLEMLVGCVEETTEEVCGNYSTMSAVDFSGQRGETPAKDLIITILDPVNHQLLPSFYHLESATLLGVWGKLFRREVIAGKHLRFDENLRLGEDMLFHIYYLENIQNVTLVDEPVFFYRQHEASATRNFKAQDLKHRQYLFEQLEKIEKKDEVFVISTMLQLAGYVEAETRGIERKKMRQELRAFWRGNEELLKKAKGKRLSAGKIQNPVYQLCAVLLRWRMYRLEENFLKLYKKVS